MNLVPFSLVLLSMGTSACGAGQLQMPPEAEFKHQHDAAYAAQVKLLKPEELSITSVSENSNDTLHTYLEVFVHNADYQAKDPALLEPQVKKLARLLVLDLKNPADFELVTIRLQTDHDYILAQTTDARTFRYPVDSLK